MTYLTIVLILYLGNLEYIFHLQLISILTSLMAIILDGQHRCRTRSLVLKLGYTMQSPEKLEKMLVPESWSHDTCVFALGCHLGTGVKSTQKTKTLQEIQISKD